MIDALELKLSRARLSARASAAPVLFDDDDTNRAEELFGGGLDGPFPLDVDSRFRTFSAASLPSAPFVVEVQAKAPGIATVFSPTVGLAWDGARRLEAPKRVVSNGTTTSFLVESVKGGALEVWADDAGKLFDARVLSRSEGERRQDQRGDQEAAKDPTRVIVLGVVAVLLGLGTISILSRRI